MKLCKITMAHLTPHVQTKEVVNVSHMQTRHIQTRSHTHIAIIKPFYLNYILQVYHTSETLCSRGGWGEGGGRGH